MHRIDVVYSLITNEAKTKVLMVKNKDNERWTLPGGPKLISKREYSKVK
ncbi:hypothetical protein [Paenibacillus dokdonensis]|nr:hypothetical protein [Paenibacillus dokdonensis]